MTWPSLANLEKSIDIYPHMHDCLKQTVANKARNLLGGGVDGKREKQRRLGAQGKPG